MTTFLYIAGRGHSGSTMIDGMLGNASGIESVGELVSGMGRYDALCSCGKTFRACGYWEMVRGRFENKSQVKWDIAVRCCVEQAHLKSFVKTVTATSDSAWVRKLKYYSVAIAEAIGDSNNKFVVDSSKEITRALFLLRFVPGSKVIHLVRHPASILQSDYYRLVKGSGFKFLRRVFFPKKIFWPFLLLSCISWITGNILVELVRYFGRDRVLRVRYEDLISSPKHEIERIEKFIDINLDSIKSKIINNIPFSIGHNIGGNHMRMSGSFIFDPSKSKRNGLPRKYRLMANIVCGPLLWVYGYRTLTE